MTRQEKSPAGSSSTWDQNTWRNTHEGFKAIDLQIKGTIHLELKG